MKLLLVSKLDRMARGASTIANYVQVGRALGRLATAAALRRDPEDRGRSGAQGVVASNRRAARCHARVGAHGRAKSPL
jgi:hypothetical protein